jgi:hypothetical protein
MYKDYKPSACDTQSTVWFFRGKKKGTESNCLYHLGVILGRTVDALDNSSQSFFKLT